MVDKDLTLALCALQEAAQKACIEAKRAGNEQLFYALRRIGWATADAMAMAVKDQAAEVAS